MNTMNKEDYKSERKIEKKGLFTRFSKYLG